MSSSISNVHSVARHCSSAACSNIESAGEKFRMCSQCRRVFYCCVTCQKADWKAGHKQECAPVERRETGSSFLNGKRVRAAQVQQAKVTLGGVERPGINAGELPKTVQEALKSIGDKEDSLFKLEPGASKGATKAARRAVQQGQTVRTPGGSFVRPVSINFAAAWAPLVALRKGAQTLANPNHFSSIKRQLGRALKECKYTQVATLLHRLPLEERSHWLASVMDDPGIPQHTFILWCQTVTLARLAAKQYPKDLLEGHRDIKALYTCYTKAMIHTVVDQACMYKGVYCTWVSPTDPALSPLPPIGSLMKLLSPRAILTSLGRYSEIDISPDQQTVDIQADGDSLIEYTLGKLLGDALYNEDRLAPPSWLQIFTAQQAMGVDATRPKPEWKMARVRGIVRVFSEIIIVTSGPLTDLINRRKIDELLISLGYRPLQDDAWAEIEKEMRTQSQKEARG